MCDVEWPKTLHVSGNLETQVGWYAEPHQPTLMEVNLLDGADPNCLGTFGALLDLELHALVFLECAIAASLDLRVVDEEVLRAVVRGDEAEALVTVEPFHSSLCHLLSSFI
jgi:hypothetical protein